MSYFLGWAADDSDQKPFSLLDFLIQWIIKTAGFGLYAHEYGHLMGAKLIGMYAEIRTTNLAAVYPDMNRFPLTVGEHLIFYGAGGFAQCVFFLILNVRNSDRENRLVNGMVAVQGLIYGVFEAMAPRSLWGFGGLLGSIAGFMVFFAFLVWRRPEIVA